MKHTLLFIAVLSLLCGCRSGESTSGIPAVRNFVLARYLGKWHEAARIPHWFERGMERVTAEYFLAPDGRCRVRNRGARNGKEHISNGKVRLKEKNTGILEVSFFPPFYSEYRIIALKEDYSAALVTSSSKDYAWILLRDPKQADRVIPEYTALLKQWGFDCSKLEFPRMTE